MEEFIIQYWLQALFGLVIFAFSFALRWLFAQFKALKLGMQAILRNNLIEQYNRYSIDKCIPIYALENVEQMYKQYKALDGNGTIKHLYDELLELPIGERKR